MKRQNNETRRTALRHTVRRSAGVVLLATCMLMAGCAKEFEEVTGGAGGGKRIELSFEAPQMDEVHVETRMVLENNMLVENLWVIQLNEAGTALLQPSIYFSRVLDNRVVLNLTDQRGTIIFIANTGDETLFSGATTAAQVVAVAKSFSTYDEFMAAPAYMSYRFKGTPEELKGQAIKLVRPYAKIEFDISCSPSNNETFSLRRVRLCNVPKTVHLYRDPDAVDPGTTASATYPATMSGFNGEWINVTLAGENTYSRTWYMPENGRGKGTATRQEDKTAAKALGGASGQGNYATYLEITAQVTLADGTVFKDNKYRIYLGGDAVSDYNIKRNTHYKVWCTLRGISQLDARVTVGTPTYSGDYYDYTDNRTGRFLIAKSDATSGTAVNWITGQKLCKDGWRLPTAQELGLAGIFTGRWWVNPYGFQAAWYCTSSIDRDNSNKFLGYYGTQITIYKLGTENNTYVRCVKDTPHGGKKYPYVTTNSSGQRNVIVLREGNDGVSTESLRDNINGTEWGSDSYDHNLRLPKKLQICEKSLGYDYLKNANLEAKCRDYREGGYTNWRVPNARDLNLLWVLRNEMDHKLEPHPFSAVRWQVSNVAGNIKKWATRISYLPSDYAEFPNHAWDHCVEDFAGNWTSTGSCRKTKGDIICVRDA